MLEDAVRAVRMVLCSCQPMFPGCHQVLGTVPGRGTRMNHAPTEVRSGEAFPSPSRRDSRPRSDSGAGLRWRQGMMCAPPGREGRD